MQRGLTRGGIILCVAKALAGTARNQRATTGIHPSCPRTIASDPDPG